MSHVLKFSVLREQIESARKLPSIRPVVLQVDVNEEKLLVRVTSQEPLTEDVVRRWLEQNPTNAPSSTELPACCVVAPRPSFQRLIALLAVAIFLGLLLSKLGLLTPTVALGSTVSIGAAFLLGLFAASSSCLAVSGGLLLSVVGKVRDMRQVSKFVVGRIVSYTILGGVIGLIGSSLLLSPTLLGVLTILAAAYMLIMGLDLLHLAPRQLKNILPRLPPRLTAHRSSSPILLGAATFFLPCGFTQALQLYALTTGSAATSALLLGAFALGTTPSLLALGWASSSLKGKAGTFFLQLSGAAVMILGLWNIQNGLTIIGYPLRLPTWQATSVATDAAGAQERALVDGGATDPNVEIADGEQVIRMTLTASDPYYYPSDRYTVEVGTPVRIEIDGEGTGCRSVFQIPKLKVRSEVTQEVNVIQFTPKKTGEYAFSCSMGMFRGTLNVIEAKT